ncbi:MAG: ABC transporter permease [Candidatus Velthaea sp.]
MNGQEKRPNRWLVAGIQISIVVLLLLAWQWGADTKHIDTFFFASPAQIGASIAKWWSKGYVVGDVAVTMEETLLGLFIGGFVGIVLGVLLASNRLLGAVFEPFLVVLNAMPRVTLVPLFILWFGFTIWSKVMGATVLVLFVVFFATYAGIKDVDATLVASARVLGAKRVDVVRHVLVPSALTWIFASLRSAVGFALIGAVVAEYLGANAGVGYRIQASESQLDTSGVFGGLAILMALVFVVDTIIRQIQRRLIVWKPTSL